MVLVFILCIIVALLILMFIMLILSTIRLKIDNFELSNMKKQMEKLNKEYKVTITLYLFNKIKWFSFRLNDKKMRKMYSKMNLEKIDLKKIEKDFKLSDLKLIKKLNLKIDYLNLESKIGTENAMLTSFIIVAISTFISILLPYTVKKYEKEKYNYMIMPVYINKNVYEIKLKCIIETKMVHIINIIYVLKKKRRVDKNEQRTSNRRSYGYSYE